MTSVETVSDWSAFLDLEADWNDAVDRAGIPHPFLRHEWLRTWWGCFGAEHPFFIVIVRSGHRIQAIAPFMWEATSMYGVPTRCLRLWHNDHTPRADVIVAERPDESYRAIWNAVMDERARWDVVQLAQLPEESTTRETLAGLARTDGCKSGIWRSGSSPYLTLSGTWDEYAASLSVKFRQNLRNRMTRVRRIGEPALEVVCEGEAVNAACEDAIRLEGAAWKRTEGTAIASDSAVGRLYREFAARASARGWLRLMFLTVNGRRIATSFSVCYQRRLFLFKTGYDPVFAACSPFKLLTYFVLRDAFARGLAEVDFLGDPEPWKLEWTRTRRAHDWMFTFSGSVRGRALAAMKFRIVPALKRYRAAASLLG
jgi:CelD/BcsL family acetyltransferase involved in cellulose biosynthesis